ncbi:Protein dennd6a, partial [Rhizopus stolonifer]
MEGEIAIPKINILRHLDQTDGIRSSSSLLYSSSPSSDEAPTETDMSDVFDYPIRKQLSTSILHSPGHRLGNSASHPDLRHRTPSPPTISPGLDITEKDEMFMLEPLDLCHLQKWLVGFCVVNFDLEIGQALDYAYPPIDLTSTEQKNICFAAFPDSNVFEVGDQVFNIRVKASSKFAASGPTADAGFLYGYVFFRQKKDASIRRGYFQKSLVLLSQHPFVGLFSRMVSILGPAFFDTGQPMLEAACMNIAQWMPPEHRVLDLPFLGRLLQVALPTPLEPQLLETSPFDMNKFKPDLQIMASLPVRGLYHHFRDILKEVWLLWELMLLAEPIVVIAPDPSVCSEAVLSLVDLIHPIHYCGDYRPYFTIQDSDFK